MPVNSRLQTTKIIGQRKVFYRQIIPEFSCARKETVDTEKFSANNFSLSEAEDNTSRPLNRWVIVGLPLLRSLLAFCQNSREPSFWKVIVLFY